MPWLGQQRPDWKVIHTSELELSTSSDAEIADWALANEAVVLTFDEDFLDTRRFTQGIRPPTVRLRIWPTTHSQIVAALLRLLAEVPDEVLQNSAVVVSRRQIRVRPR